MYPREKIVVPSVPEGYLETLPKPAQRSLLRKKEQVNLEHELAVQAIQAYYASITFADAQVGRVMATLAATGQMKHTIIVLWGDHCWHLGEHAIWGKHALFDESVRSPLIIRYDEIPQPGASSESLVETLDLFPTLCDLAGLPGPQGLPGTTQPRRTSDTRPSTSPSVKPI